MADIDQLKERRTQLRIELQRVNEEIERHDEREYRALERDRKREIQQLLAEHPMVCFTPPPLRREPVLAC
jgi:hypothetical protein